MTELVEVACSVEPKTNEKLSYIKLGDAVSELPEVSKGRAIHGGHNYYVYSVAVALSSCFDRTSIVSFAYPGAACATVTRGNASARTHVLPKMRLARPLAMAYRVLAHLVRFRPRSILCAHSLPILLPVWLYSTVLRRPFVASIHSDMESISSTVRRGMTAFLLRRARAIICHGPYLRSQVERLLRHPHVLEYRASCSDLLEFAASDRPDLTSKCGSGYILYTGRIIQGKGVFDLLDASTELLAAQPGLRLIYAGSGEEEERLRQRAGSHSHGKQVIVLGRVSRNDIGWLVKHARVVVTPTRTSFPEGLCMSAIEAVAMGIPLVAPRFGPFEHIVTDGDNGLLFEPDSVESLRKQLMRVCTDEATYAALVSGAARESPAYLSDDLGYDKMVLQAFSRSRK